MDDETEKTEKKWKLILGSVLLPSIFSLINTLSGLDIIDIFQMVFNAVVTSVKKYDPIEIGDVKEWGLRNGVLKGLSSLKPHKDLSVSVNDDDKMVLGAILCAKDIQICYEWEYQFLFKFSGTIAAKQKILVLMAEVQGEMTKDAVVFSELTKSALHLVSGCEFDFTGLWLLNLLVGKLMSYVYKTKKDEIQAKLNLLMKDTLKKQLSFATSAINSYFDL